VVVILTTPKWERKKRESIQVCVSSFFPSGPDNNSNNILSLTRLRTKSYTDISVIASKPEYQSFYLRDIMALELEYSRSLLRDRYAAVFKLLEKEEQGDFMDQVESGLIDSWKISNLFLLRSCGPGPSFWHLQLWARAASELGIDGFCNLR
jgi:hypothetical protein